MIWCDTQKHNTRTNNKAYVWTCLFDICNVSLNACSLCAQWLSLKSHRRVVHMELCLAVLLGCSWHLIFAYGLFCMWNIFLFTSCVCLWKTTLQILSLALSFFWGTYSDVLSLMWLYCWVWALTHYWTFENLITKGITIFLPLVTDILKRKVFVYKLQSCAMHHMMN